jgi:putative transcriptional regulator
MDSLQGHLLVASPHLRDPNFMGTVVLLVRHDEQGALGVVLNRPTEKTLMGLWASVSQTPCENDPPVNLGGPVPGPLMAIHTREALADEEVLPGVYFAAEKDHLEALVAKPQPFLRVFVGHSGWGGGQLEGELEQGAWFTTPATLEFVFYDDTDLWQKVTRMIGKSVIQDILKIKDVPDDPSAN